MMIQYLNQRGCLVDASGEQCPPPSQAGGTQQRPAGQLLAAVPSRPMATRRPRRAVVVLAGSGAPTGDQSARALARSLGELSVETTYLGRTDSVPRIATAVTDQSADAVEICFAGHGGVLLLRGLLRELVRIGRSEVSIVVHRVA